MVPTSRLSRPLQRRCAHCRRVQDVRLSALYHVVVPNKGGGTRRDGGYDCRFCGSVNIIPATEMPQGLVLQLPSREEQIAAKAPAPTEPVQSATPASDAEPPTPAIATPAPPRPPAKRLAAPSWIVGAKARAILATAFARVATAKDGICTAFVRTDGAPKLVDPRGEIASGDILDWLDRTACELLVLGGSETDGSRWKAIFHPLAGAATLTIEPVAA